jgi:hypothetical protein
MFLQRSFLAILSYSRTLSTQSVHVNPGTHNRPDVNLLDLGSLAIKFDNGSVRVEADVRKLL